MVEELSICASVTLRERFNKIMQPFNFFISLLGLSQTSTTSPRSKPTGATCAVNSSNSVPRCTRCYCSDPEVRLRFSDDNTVRMFGFPPDDLPPCQVSRQWRFPCSLPSRKRVISMCAIHLGQQLAREADGRSPNRPSVALPRRQCHPSSRSNQLQRHRRRETSG